MIGAYDGSEMFLLVSRSSQPEGVHFFYHGAICPHIGGNTGIFALLVVKRFIQGFVASGMHYKLANGVPNINVPSEASWLFNLNRIR